MMMLAVTVVRQYLVAVFLVAISLIAAGCGDTATVNQGAQLGSLMVSPGTLSPTFSSGTTQYNVQLNSNVSSVIVTAQPAVGGDTVTINGQNTTSSVITLGAAGTTTPVNIVVSGSGANPGGYTVHFVRAGLTGNNSLESLTVSPGALDSPFDANDLSYKVDVANNVTSVTISATKSDPNAVMLIGSVTVPAGTPSGSAPNIPLGGPGSATPVSIVVTAQNGNPKTYLVTVSRGISSNSNLRSLSISPGTLTPTFSAGTILYTVNLPATLPSNVTIVTVTPTLQDPTASMTVNGQAATSGQAKTAPLPAPGSSNFVNILVTAQNGTQKPYSVNFIRAALGGNNNLSALAVSPGTLAPAFSAGTVAYTVNVGSTVTSVTVTPRLQDTTASMTMNGQATNSGQSRTVPLNGAGSNTFINIAVTAQNGNQKTYVINVIQAALGGNNNLSALTVSPGALDSAFSANDLNYTVNVGSSVTSVNVSATKADPNAVMSNDVTAGAGNATGQASIPLGGPGTTTTVLIDVTAPNGSSKTYRINVIKAALASNNNLSALSVTPGPLSPAFVANTLGYTVNVASNVTSVAVSATKADSNAVISGDVPNSGQANITLSGPGTTTSVSIIVTAPSGASKTYSIDVIRAAPAAPPAPASAPDLIAADDSCLRDPVTNGCVPPTSDGDNITNVATPRFQIPAPGAGETPNLYVDGVKVGSTFDQGANTIQPTTALTDGQHMITSTVTNAGGESSPSPPLPVTIDTVAPTPR